jgi:two-component system nitrogen regulation response regulator NtrX
MQDDLELVMFPERILIVDDEKGILTSLSNILQDEQYATEVAEDGEGALRLLETDGFDLVLLDIWLPGIDGIETLKRIKELRSNVPVIMISGHGTIEMAVAATKLGAYDFIEKPLSLDKVILSVQHALRQKRLEDENRALRRKIEKSYEIVGTSAQIEELRRQIAVVAPTNARVLICGENGTGKELVARAIHRQSARGEAPFVEVNCAAIPDDLIENELFGHEKGSYTGASSEKTGKFELANGGTIFLDEIGDMSLKTQSKVLRVLEEQAFQRIGGTDVRKIDVRVIAATNKDLEEEMKAGSFREDLYYRLNVVVFQVAPLRERPGDVPVLAEHCLRMFSQEYGKKCKRLTPEALAALVRYRWPGNVRELKNAIERAVIMVPGESIKVSDLPPSITGQTGPKLGYDGEFDSLRAARMAFEKEYILRALEENDGNITRTAEKLDIRRSNLYAKLHLHQIHLGGR